MFPSRYYGDRYYAPRYFPPLGAEAEVSGGGGNRGGTFIRFWEREKERDYEPREDKRKKRKRYRLPDGRVIISTREQAEALAREVVSEQVPETWDEAAAVAAISEVLGAVKVPSEIPVLEGVQALDTPAVPWEIVVAQVLAERMRREQEDLDMLLLAMI